MTTRRHQKPKAPTDGQDGSAQTDAHSPPSFAALEKLLGRNFKNPELLRLALTHRSFAYEERNEGASIENSPTGRNAPGEDNEQLEFLGDAVLGLAVAEALFREFPDRNEGELTRMRASLVGRERMAQMGAALGLGELLLLGKSAERNSGRRKPALLANAAEAVLAAVYLDAGVRGPEVVREIVQRFLIAPELASIRAALENDPGHGALRDSKTLLQERVQAESAGRLRYVDTGQSGPAHQRTFSVEARLENEAGTRVLAAAEGNSKKEAQQRAAALALERWQTRPTQDHARSAGGAS